MNIIRTTEYQGSIINIAMIDGKILVNASQIGAIININVVEYLDKVVKRKIGILEEAGCVWMEKGPIKRFLNWGLPRKKGGVPKKGRGCLIGFVILLFDI